MSKSFRHPDEMEDEKEEREPVSARIRSSTKQLLEKAADKKGKSLAWLLANVLEDYGTWLRAEGKKDGK